MRCRAPRRQAASGRTGCRAMHDRPRRPRWPAIAAPDLQCRSAAEGPQAAASMDVSAIPRCRNTPQQFRRGRLSSVTPHPSAFDGRKLGPEALQLRCGRRTRNSLDRSERLGVSLFGSHRGVPRWIGRRARCPAASRYLSLTSSGVTDFSSRKRILAASEFTLMPVSSVWTLISVMCALCTNDPTGWVLDPRAEGSSSASERRMFARLGGLDAPDRRVTRRRRFGAGLRTLQ